MFAVAVNPRHPFGSELAAHLHAAQLARFAQATPLEAESMTIEDTQDALRSSVVEYDAYISVLRSVPPKISDTELRLVCSSSCSFVLA